MSWQKVFIPSAKEQDPYLTVSTKNDYIKFSSAAMRVLGIKGGGYVHFHYNTDTKLYYVSSSMKDGVKISKSGKTNTKGIADRLMDNNPSFQKIKDGHYRLMLSRRTFKTSNEEEVYALAKEAL